MEFYINGDKIELFKGATKDIEAEHIVSTIKKLKNQNKIESLRDVAVLYRSSYLTLPLEKALIKERITYRVFGGVRFYQRKEIKDALAYFRLITNPKDDVSFDRIINVPKRKIGEKSVELLKKESASHNLSIYEYIKNLEKYQTELSTSVVMSLTVLINNTLSLIYAKFTENFKKKSGSSNLKLMVYNSYLSSPILLILSGLTGELNKLYIFIYTNIK